ncbi:MAG: DUF6702 family protein [Salegentibacter sp.]
MKKILVILSCFFLFSAFKGGFHKYYLSVTEIEYKSDQKDLQIISKVFADDFQKLLRKRYSDDIRLSRSQEEGDVKAAIEDYLKKKLQISVDGKPLELHYLGKEYDADEVVMYIEVEGVEPFQKISVKNLLLTDMFDDQKNVVNVTVGDQVKNLLLSRDQPQGSLEF